MNASQRRLYERAQRVAAFMDAAAEDFPSNSKGDRLLVNIKDTLSIIADLDVARTTGGTKQGQGTAARTRARTKLRRMVQSTVETSEAIALDYAGAAGIFSLAGRDGSDLTLIATARTFADNAAAFAQQFTEYDLTPAFFNEMRALADSLEASMGLQTEGTEARRGSGKSIDKILQRLGEVIERLDALVSNKYRDDPDRLADWDAARRVEKAPRSHNGNNNAPPANS